MENLIIQETYNSPIVSFNYQTGILSLSGRAHPENADATFTPIIEWVEAYSESPRLKTTLEINLEYFNSSALKSILKLMADLVSAKNKSELKIIWHYYDDDSLEVAEDIEVLLEIKMDLIPEID
ncbi:MAG: DUF1987 domain-containing protein [Bacteroidales bacterium]|nr:DUF1987 domain-containing protein [Bacteroidales bacterium]